MNFKIENAQWLSRESLKNVKGGGEQHSDLDGNSGAPCIASCSTGQAVVCTGSWCNAIDDVGCQTDIMKVDCAEA